MQAKARLIGFARKLSQNPIIARWIRWMIVNFNTVLLGEKIVQTDHLYVVPHPNPAYPVHYLILPKKAIPDLLSLEANSELWNEIPGIVKVLVEKFVPQGAGFRIVANGGGFQEIPLLHFHFIAGEVNA
jgi:histidine triad (HIT) family protein